MTKIKRNVCKTPGCTRAYGRLSYNTEKCRICEGWTCQYHTWGFQTHPICGQCRHWEVRRESGPPRPGDTNRYKIWLAKRLVKLNDDDMKREHR
jgi:hypothetical protein